jgi:2-C-methyl-D-erythritol 4-phosphate cytidylyltransferase
MTDLSLKKLWVIIPAAGVGSRFGAKKPKQYLTLFNGKTVLWHTIHQLLTHPLLGQVMLALSDRDDAWSHCDVAQQLQWPVQTAMGGQTRADSVLNALLAIESMVKPDDWILVHDACRPCVSHQSISQLIESVADHAVGGLLALPSVDTLKQVDEVGQVVETIDRNTIWRAQTPQMLRYQLLRDALLHAREKKLVVTDEASAVEHMGLAPLVVTGHSHNIKITYPQDLALAELFLKEGI